MNLKQRSQAIFASLWEQGNSSIRRIAAATGIAKSSVHRHRQAIERRNQYPESPLWEMESGVQWLQRLVWAVLYVFGVKHGIGNETLSEFFHLLRLERHIGVSPTALQGIRVQMEGQILAYREEQQQQLQQSQTKVDSDLAAFSISYVRQRFEDNFKAMMCRDVGMNSDLPEQLEP